MIFLLIQFFSQISNQFAEATNEVYQSLAELIKWSDTVLLYESTFDRESVRIVVKTVKEAVEVSNQFFNKLFIGFSNFLFLLKHQTQSLVQLCVDKHQSKVENERNEGNKLTLTEISTQKLLISKKNPFNPRKGSMPSVTSLSVTTDLRKSLPDLLSDVDKHSDPYLPQHLNESPSTPRQSTNTHFQTNRFSNQLKHSLSSDSILDTPDHLVPIITTAKTTKTAFSQQPKTVHQRPIPPVRGNRLAEQPPPLPPKRTQPTPRLEQANFISNGPLTAIKSANFPNHHAPSNQLNELAVGLTQVSLSVDSIACFRESSDRTVTFYTSARKHHSDNSHGHGRINHSIHQSHQNTANSLTSLASNDTTLNGKNASQFGQVTLRRATNGTTGSIYRRRADSIDGSSSPSPPPPAPEVRLRAPTIHTNEHRDSSGSSSLGSAHFHNSRGRPRSQYDNLSLSEYECGEEERARLSCCSSTTTGCNEHSLHHSRSRLSAGNRSLRSTDSCEDQTGSALNQSHNSSQNTNTNQSNVRIHLQPPDEPPPLPPKRKNITAYMQMLGSYGRPSEATLHASYRHSVHTYHELSRTQHTYQQVEQSFRQQRALDLQLNAAANAAGLRRARATRCSQDSAISAQSFSSDSSSRPTLNTKLPTSIMIAMQQAPATNHNLNNFGRFSAMPSINSNITSSVNSSSFIAHSAQTTSSGSSNTSMNGLLGSNMTVNSSSNSMEQLQRGVGGGYSVSLCTSQCSLNSSGRASGSSANLCVNSLASDLAANLANQLASGLANQIANGQLDLNALNHTLHPPSVLLPSSTSSHPSQIPTSSNGSQSTVQSQPLQVQINCAINRDLPPMLPPKRSKQIPQILLQPLAKKPETFLFKSQSSSLHDTLVHDLKSSQLNQNGAYTISSSQVTVNSHGQSTDCMINKHDSDISLDCAERSVALAIASDGLINFFDVIQIRIETVVAMLVYNILTCAVFQGFDHCLFCRQELTSTKTDF